MKKMDSHERFHAYVTGKPVDRMPAIEWAPFWDVTVDRWHTEGLPAGRRSVFDVQDYFGLEKCIQIFTTPRTGKTPKAPSFGAGILADAEGYERIKPTLFPAPDVLFPDSRIEELRALAARDDTLLFFTAEGAFWYPRELFGIEKHFYSFYDEPELYQRMLEDYAEWLTALLRYVFSRVRFDFLTFAEDMSYNSGPMISKAIFDEFLAPFYRRMIPVIREYGVPVILDSDGDITLAVDWYASVGVDGMLPLERKAGVDVSIYLDKHPDMCFIGHFDKMCMKNGEEAMRREFERILPSMKRGRVIASVDHQTPPDVSIENYRTYVKLLYEYAAKATHEKE